MGTDHPSEEGQTIEVGIYRNCVFDVVSGDLATVEADIAIAALCSHASRQHLGAGIEGLDRALRGALARLRTDGIFTGKWGETLYLSSLPPSVRPQGVMMLGLGPTGANTLAKVRRAFKIAAIQAVSVGAVHGTFSPLQLRTGAPRFNDVATARALLLGIFDVLSRPRCSLKRWSFVAPARDVRAFADQFELAFLRIMEH